MKRLLLALLVALVPAVAAGQSTVLQGGSWSSGQVPVYSGSGGTSQPTVRTAGPASGSGFGIGEMAIVARGTGTGPYSGTGTGYRGSNFCMYDGPITGQYHQLCFSASDTGGGGLISFNAGGGATASVFNFNVNGTQYEFPFSTSGVIGPNATTVGHVATWNNTSGTLLADGGYPIGTSGAAIPILNANNTWAGTALFNGTATFGGALVSSGGSTFSGGETFNGAATFNGTTSFTNTNTFTGTSAFNAAVTIGTSGTFNISGSGSGSTRLVAAATASGQMTVPSATDTLVGKATTDTLTNKTLDTAGTGNIFKINGQTISATTAANATVLTGGTQIKASLGADVNMSNTGLYFDGPSIAQGAVGTWWVSGLVTVLDTAGAATVNCKLWDGTTVISSGTVRTPAINVAEHMALSGYLATPAGNLKISCNDATSTSGVIGFNTSGNSKDGTISAFRVN